MSTDLVATMAGLLVWYNITDMHTDPTHEYLAFLLVGAIVTYIIAENLVPFNQTCLL